MYADTISWLLEIDCVRYFALNFFIIWTISIPIQQDHVWSILYYYYYYLRLGFFYGTFSSHRCGAQGVKLRLIVVTKEVRESERVFCRGWNTISFLAI
jgi:hypothetical protein